MLKMIGFTLCLWSFNIYSQTRQIDSLKKILDRHTTRDTTRVGYILKYANAVLFSRPDSILKYGEEAMEISKSLKWQWGIARAYNLKAIYSSYIKNEQIKALDYYQRAVKENKEPFSPVLAWQTQTNIGLIYFNTKQYSKALENFLKAFSISDTLEDKTNQEQLLHSIGNVYYELKQYDSARKYFFLALDIAQKKKNYRIEAGCLNSLATFYLGDKNYKEAQLAASKSADLAEKTGDIAVLANSYVNLSIAKFNLNETDSAAYYGKEALKLAEKSQTMQFRRQAWEALSMVYERQKNYQKAFEATKNFSVLNDSLLSDEQTTTVLINDLQNEQEKREAILNKEHQSEMTQQRAKRNMLISSSLFIIVILGLVFFQYKRRRDASLKQQQAEFRSKVTETEMKALRAQMNPHFIFNSLNSISDYISKNNIPEADKYLGKFAKLMRMILENSEQKEVSIKEDLKALEMYMELEALRMNNKFKYEIKVDPGIDQEQTMVPPLILQPFVENSILHGFAGKTDPGKILIQIRKEGNMINCVVEDNGTGRKSSTPINLPAGIEKKSIGMKITKSRIDILNKIKNSKGGVELFDIPQGLRVEVKLPLILQF